MAMTNYPEPIDWRQNASTLAEAINWTGRDREAAPLAAAVRPDGLLIELVSASFGGTMSVYPPGTITRCDEQLWVQTGRGHLELKRIRANGQEVDAAPWFSARGYCAGDVFDARVSEDYSHAA